jgi:hypothetical protein
MLSDTSPAAEAVYFGRLAEMTPAERIAIGIDLWNIADSIQRAVLRRENPDADEEELTFRAAVRRFGEELARKAYGRQ